MKRRLVAVVALFVNRRFRVSIYVVPVMVKKVPYGVVVAYMN
jgi:hypothetical protein